MSWINPTNKLSGQLIQICYLQNIHKYLSRALSTEKIN